MHTTIWKFESKNSQEYHHLVWTEMGQQTAQAKTSTFTWSLGDYTQKKENRIGSQTIHKGRAETRH